MPLRDETGQGESITAPRPALEYFTNRRGSIRRFAEYLNDSPEDRILYFHGDGGNGKTLLLRYLRQNCCKRLSADGWEYVRSLEGDAFVENIVHAVDYADIPSSMIDFGAKPRGEDRPKEAFPALLKMRRDLSGHLLPFPRFDFGCVLYLQKKRSLSKEKLKELFPQSESDLIAALADAISQTAWGSITKAVLGLFNKDRLKEKFTLHQYQKKIDAELIHKLREMEADTELYPELLTLFAEDLNDAMLANSAPPRAALFFDTHEAFWDVWGRKYSAEKYHLQDEWLRRLLLSLDFKKGIIAIVAGREKPRWNKATQERIRKQNIDNYRIGPLAANDAAIYLEKVDISNPELKTSLLKFAEELPNEVHPYLLGLCADVVLAARRSGIEITAEEFRDIPAVSEKGRALMNRLRIYIDASTVFAIEALCACRSFDRELYVHLMKALNLKSTIEDFYYLTEFSFVWDAEDQGEGWYRIHDLMRRLTYDQKEEMTLEARRQLKQYYAARANEGDITAIAERLYHGNRLDSSAGSNEWVEEMKQALIVSRFDLCRVLMAIRSGLLVVDVLDRGRISQEEGKYYAALSIYENARVEYQAAIAAFEEALRRAPDYVTAYNNKAEVLFRLGDLQAGLSEGEAAEQSYRGSIATSDEALRRAPDDVIARINKGYALSSLGDLQAGLSQCEAAEQSYRESIAAHNEALRRAPDDVIARINKGSALSSLGDLQADLSEHRAAEQSYWEAIRLFDEALGRAPNDVIARINKGYALSSLGNLQAGLSQCEGATESYRMAIDVFDEALRRAPDDVTTHISKGNALRGLGDLQADLSEHRAAEQSYWEAIGLFDEALGRAPNDVNAYNNKGFVLRGFADLQAGLSQSEAAEQSYRMAIAVFDEVLRRAPDDVYAHANKGNSLRSLGDLQAGLSQCEGATESYRMAIDVFDEALCRAPDDVFAHTNKGNALRGLADLQAGLPEHQSAESAASYEQAIALFDEALLRAPDDVTAHNDKAKALRRLGDLRAELSEHPAAQESYGKALTYISRSLEIAPAQERIRILRDVLKKMIAD